MIRNKKGMPKKAVEQFGKAFEAAGVKQPKKKVYKKPKKKMKLYNNDDAPLGKI